ncbi:MAG: YlxR family protein [Dehalococcoidia bacterium]|nr:YlxR family protein [Dehalococcoidia bacterium]
MRNMTSGSSNALVNKDGAARHVPQRTCISCRQSTAKRGLVRVVRLLNGSVQVDPTGKKSGRGAYICWDRQCWEAALKKRSLERALKTIVAPEDRAALESYARQITEGEVGPVNPPLRGIS